MLMLMLDNLHQGQSHLPSGVLPSMSMYSPTKKTAKIIRAASSGLGFPHRQRFQQPVGHSRGSDASHHTV